MIKILDLRGVGLFKDFIISKIPTKTSELENDAGFITDENIEANNRKELVSTLTTGQTSLSFTDEKINSSSTIDIYSSVYGVSPKNMTISGHTLTLTFKAQDVDVDVKVVIS